MVSLSEKQRPNYTIGFEAQVQILWIPGIGVNIDKTTGKPCKTFNQNERGSLLEDDLVLYLKLCRRSIFQTVKLHVDWMVRDEIS